MARYIRDLPFQGDAQAVYNQVAQYLQGEGYTYQSFEGENVFKKGDGVVSGPTFFKLSFAPGMVRLEAWMKYAILPGVYAGELGLDGFVGWAVKGPLKKRVAYIEGLLQQSSGFASPMIPAQNSYAQQSYPMQSGSYIPQPGYQAQANGYAPQQSVSYDPQVSPQAAQYPYQQPAVQAQANPFECPNDGQTVYTVNCRVCGAQCTSRTSFCHGCGSPLSF